MGNNFKHYLASFDVSPSTIEYIKKGILDFTIDQQPYMQSYITVKLLVLAARYQMAPPDINTGVRIVDKTNASIVEKLTRQYFR